MYGVVHTKCVSTKYMRAKHELSNQLKIENIYSTSYCIQRNGVISYRVIASIQTRLRGCLMHPECQRLALVIQDNIFRSDSKLGVVLWF